MLKMKQTLKYLTSLAPYQAVPDESKKEVNKIKQIEENGEDKINQKEEIKELVKDIIKRVNNLKTKYVILLMSGNRANASARNKRAGGADINSNGGPSPMPGQRGPGYPGQGQQMAQPKLSISDAIGLITLRLGRVEQLVQTIQTNPNDPTSIPEDNGNNVLVDKQVFDNIVKRLDTLEKQKVSLAPGLTPPQALAQAHSQAQAQVQSQTALSQLVSIQKYDIFVKDVAKEFKEMKDLIAAKQSSNEIAELKEMLLKLQTFTMETNSKLVNMIFSDSAQFEILETEEPEEKDNEGEELIDDFNMKFFGSGSARGSASGSASGSGPNIIELSQSGFNLKELIQQELQSESVVEELSA